MRINTNAWNRIRYTLYSPGYDLVGGVLNKSRKISISKLDIKANDKVLIVGAGTGLDLEFLPAICEITATDITPAMLDRAVKRNKKFGLNLKAIVMDGQNLDFPDNSFDKIILHLILAVIPDPVACLKEAERVLKPDGKIVIYDKFIPSGYKPNIIRKLTNLFTNTFFSNINRCFEEILRSTGLKVEEDVKADLGGMFRIIVLKK